MFPAVPDEVDHHEADLELEVFRESVAEAGGDDSSEPLVVEIVACVYAKPEKHACKVDSAAA